MHRAVAQKGNGPVAYLGRPARGIPLRPHARPRSFGAALRDAKNHTGPTRWTRQAEAVLPRNLASDLWEKYHANPDGLVAYYKANLELVYWDGVFRVDDELRSLGPASNREVETLEHLFEPRKDPAHQEIAQRLLNRYTDGRTKFDFQNGRDRIYFSDVGGYKFFVVPEGYGVRPTSQNMEAQAVSP